MNFDNNQTNSIPEFYNGKSVFITGGTGFLGKVLVEKLLRSCPGIESVYLLVRSKKGKSVNERLDELKSSKVFDILREKDPQAMRKIILIEGDTSKIDLGISKENRELLCDKVSVIFNSAANVKFDESLKEVIKINLRSLQELIKLSRQFKNLKSFIHISTAYSNWFQLDVKEQFYPTDYDPHYVMDMCNTSTDEQLENFKALLGKHVNTYTFSKALAEDLIFRTAKDLPIAIVRPSTVGASMTEPKAGWVDSYTAGTPYVDQVSRGLFRSTHCDKNIIFDLIPVDIVINLTIAVAWKVSQTEHQKLAMSEPPIYNCVSGNSNPLTIKHFLQLILDAGRSNPSDMMSWYPQMRYFKTRFLNDIDNFVTQFIPALMSDSLAKLKGENGLALKHLKRSQSAFDQVRFIMNSPIKMHGENYQKVLESMNQVDQKNFNLDPRTINWKNYMESFYFGVRKYIYNDKSVNSIAAKRKYARFRFANYMISGTIIAGTLLTGKELSDRLLRKKEPVNS